MYQPRAPLESEVPTVIQFLDKNLRAHHGWSITSEYPSVFTLNNRSNIRVIVENDRVVAHSAIKYLHIKNVMGIFKVAAIGSVVTDPEFRQQGLSQKILENCILSAEAEGADFAILWSDLYDFYKKMGFELAGTEVSMVIDSQPPLYSKNDIRFMTSAKISPDAILRLYSQHTCGSMRTAEEIRKCLTIPNSQVFTAWNHNNELLAYAVEGKGADLKGYIHEWGGGVNHLLPLLAHVRSQIGQPITIIAPAHAQNLIRQLQEWSVITNYGFLGMICPLHMKNIFFKISRYARQLGIDNLILEQTEQGYVVGTKEDQTLITSNAEMIKLLFGPVEKLELSPEFQKILPIPMWVWGWDSI